MPYTMLDGFGKACTVRMVFAKRSTGSPPETRHAMFNCHARNKLSMTVDIRRPEGQEVVRRLVQCSDAVIDNFSAEVMDRMGFSYEVLRGWKPDIILDSGVFYCLTLVDTESASR